jgi:hypothetical protein
MLMINSIQKLKDGTDNGEAANLMSTHPQVLAM